jgi:Holliday junction resolvase RusA-like endonuclease
MKVFLRCVPPSTTAQQKRLVMVGGKPRFFHSKRLLAEEEVWGILLGRHIPAAPFEGPLTLTVRYIYPHKKRTSKQTQAQLIPKITKPDAGNAAKHFEDVLVKLRFVVDDAQFARVTFEKWHGPAHLVGIDVAIEKGVSG